MPKDVIDQVEADWDEQRPELDTQPIGLVLRIQTLARLHMQLVSNRLADFGLQWWQYDVLSVLRRKGKPFESTATELAEQSMLSSGAMTHRIDRLAEAGLVERDHVPSDRRKVLVRLTPKGTRLVDTATEARFEVADRALRGLNGRQQRKLSALLRLMMEDA